MAKKTRDNFQLGLGIPSIFTLFVILVMLILAVLTYVKANSYHASTLRQVAYMAHYDSARANIVEVFTKLNVHHVDEQLKKMKIDYTKHGNVYIIEEDMNEDSKVCLSFHANKDRLIIDAVKVIDKDDTNGN